MIYRMKTKTKKIVQVKHRKKINLLCEQVLLLGGSLLASSFLRRFLQDFPEASHPEIKHQIIFNEASF